METDTSENVAISFQPVNTVFVFLELPSSTQKNSYHNGNRYERDC